MKNIYFLSDAHLGSRAITHKRTHERRLVNFLDKIKDKAEAIYMLGDMFDFWFEYNQVVPKGYTRFLGKLSELTDMGVEIHYFTGNHDQWMNDYLEKECGIIIHKEECVCEINGKIFFLAHGDGLDYRDKNWKTQLLFSIFKSNTLRSITRRFIHPDPFFNFALNWAKHSRTKRRGGNMDERKDFENVTKIVGYESDEGNGEEPYKGEDKEGLVLFAKDYLKNHPDINYFIFGHRHIELDLLFGSNSRLILLGEWMTLFTYAVFNGETMIVDNFIEGESEV